MKTMLRLLLASALALLPLSEALAGSSTITTKDAAGATKTFFVTTDGGGNFYAAGVICDATAAASCATVTAGSLSVSVTNANANGTAITANSSPVNIASDQVAVAVKAASGVFASGSFASGALASGSVASGAVASGAYASGSLASGAVVDITNMSVATGAAPPSKAIYLGANASGATGGFVRGLINCDNHVFKHITSATDTLAVQGVASQTVYICGWRSRAAGVATWFLENTASANANCSSSNTQITGVATEAANTGEVAKSAFWDGLKNTSGNGLCINSTGTGGVDIDIWYTQF